MAAEITRQIYAFLLECACTALSEPIAKFHAQHPRPGDGLRRNELRGGCEHALVHVGQILRIQLQRPGIFGDTQGCVILRIGGIFESKQRGAHARPCGERGTVARRERIAQNGMTERVGPCGG